MFRHLLESNVIVVASCLHATCTPKEKLLLCIVSGAVLFLVLTGLLDVLCNLWLAIQFTV